MYFFMTELKIKLILFNSVKVIINLYFEKDCENMHNNFKLTFVKKLKKKLKLKLFLKNRVTFKNFNFIITLKLLTRFS